MAPQSGAMFGVECSMFVFPAGRVQLSSNPKSSIQNSKSNLASGYAS